MKGKRKKERRDKERRREEKKTRGRKTSTRNTKLNMMATNRKKQQKKKKERTKEKRKENEARGAGRVPAEVLDGGLAHAAPAVNGLVLEQPPHGGAATLHEFQSAAT